MPKFMDSIKEFARRLSRSVRAFIQGITDGVSKGVDEITGKRDEKLDHLEERVLPSKKNDPNLKVFTEGQKKKKDQDGPDLNIFKGDKGDPDLTVFKNSQTTITQALPPTKASNSSVLAVTPTSTPVNLQVVDKPNHKKPSYAEVALKAVSQTASRPRMG